MLQLVGASELKIRVYAESGIDFDSIEIGQPTGKLGLGFQPVHTYQQPCDDEKVPVVHACKKTIKQSKGGRESVTKN